METVDLTYIGFVEGRKEKRCGAYVFE